MPGTGQKPTLLQDVSAIAGLYLDVLRLMEKRITGHALIVTYSPPDPVAYVAHEEAPAAKGARERAHAVH